MESRLWTGATRGSGDSCRRLPFLYLLEARLLCAPSSKVFPSPRTQRGIRAWATNTPPVEATAAHTATRLVSATTALGQRRVGGVIRNDWGGKVNGPRALPFQSAFSHSARRSDTQEQGFFEQSYPPPTRTVRIMVPSSSPAPSGASGLSAQGDASLLHDTTFTKTSQELIQFVTQLRALG